VGVNDTAITERDKAAVTREQWRNFLRSMPRGGTSNLGVAACFALAVGFSAAPLGAAIWFALALLTNGLRILGPRIWGKRALGRIAPRRARIRLLAVTWASGLTWGIGFVTLLPGTSIGLHGMAVGLAAGVSAGAVTTTGHIVGAFLGIMLPVLLPLMLVLLIEASAMALALAGVVAIGVSILVPAAHDLNSKLLALMRTHRVNRRLIQELGIERDRAAASDRAKSEFLATMSHEIRTPMNGVLGMAELLAKTPLNPTQRQYVDSLHKSGRVLLNLINDVLDVSKIESGKFELGDEAFDLGQIMHELEQMFAPRAEDKEVALFVGTADDAARAYAGDPTRVQQILMNLISNAIKFTDEGEIRVRASVLAQTRETTTVMFEVIDTGPGIPEDKQANIFGAFDQADTSRTRHHGGTGLGLHIAQKLTHLMGGRIGVISTPREGSTFWVTLPLAHAQDVPTGPRRLPPAQAHRVGTRLTFEQPVAADPSTETSQTTGSSQALVSGAAGRGGRILLAEDNVVNQQVATKMLEELGCTVVTVGSGDDALTQATRDPEPFDLIFMDCDMPGMDGFDATRRIRAEGYDQARLPIVALTASAMRGDRDKCLAVGMTSYIAKPVSQSDLSEILAAYLPDFGHTQAGDADFTTTGAAQATTDAAAPTVSAVRSAGSEAGTRMMDDILDPTTVQRLRALTKPDGPDVFAQLADQFTRSSSQQVQDLEAAIHNMDAMTVKRTAHSLKSSSASVGALKLSHHFRRIENAGKDADLATAQAALDDVQAELDDVQRALRTLRDDPNAQVAS
jgi:signal transduction histidine kinase/CheY-like chemotaxis protein